MSGRRAVCRSRRAGLLAPVLVGALLAGLTPVAAGSPSHTPPRSGLTALVGLASERILLADKVAAAKCGTAAPIEDPAREQQVLEQAAALATQAGLDAPRTVAYFRAQIEMSKAVQRGLIDLWTAHPELAPTERPDLATEVRPQLDRITVGLIDQLVATADLRGRTPRCQLSLVVAEKSATHQFRLDVLHRRALRGAVAPICGGQGTAPGR